MDLYVVRDECCNADGGIEINPKLSWCFQCVAVTCTCNLRACLSSCIKHTSQDIFARAFLLVFDHCTRWILLYCLRRHIPSIIELVQHNSSRRELSNRIPSFESTQPSFLPCTSRSSIKTTSKLLKDDIRAKADGLRQGKYMVTSKDTSVPWLCSYVEATWCTNQLRQRLAR